MSLGRPVTSSALLTASSSGDTCSQTAGSADRSSRRMQTSFSLHLQARVHPIPGSGNQGNRTLAFFSMLLPWRDHVMQIAYEAEETLHCGIGCARRSP